MKKNNDSLSLLSGKCGSAVIVSLIGLVFGVSDISGQAQTYNLSARNAGLQVDLGGSGAGVSDWTINGVNQLQQQWFYYSVGTGTLNSIDTISPWTAPTITGGNNPTLSETYANSGISLTAAFQLQSGLVGAANSSLATTITIDNPSAVSETYHFYQYSDFGLGGTTANQNVQFAGTTAPYKVTQTALTGGPLIGQLTSISGGSGDTVEEAAGTSNFGLANGNPAPNFSSSSHSASGSATYAYEIDVTVASGSSVIISEIQTVPEPSNVSLLFAGLAGFAAIGRRGLAFLKKS